MRTPATSDSDAAEASPRRQRSWLKRFLGGFLLFVLVWLAGDFGYSLYVSVEIRKWETQVPWSEAGLAPGAAEYTVGKGSIGLLMVHGFSDSPQMYRKLAPVLAQRGYACRCILLPGFGRTVEAYADSSAEQWLEKVQAETEMLRRQHDQVFIVAHSLGGAITVQHLLRHTGQVDGVVLLAPAIEVSNLRSPIFPTRFWHEFGKIALPSTTITYSPFEMDARDPAERDRPDRNRFSPRRVVDNTFQLIDANRGRADELELPMLIFLSTTDQVVDSVAIEDFFEHSASSDKRLIRLENSGHMIPVDLEWRTVVEEIDRFVSNGAFLRAEVMNR